MSDSIVQKRVAILATDGFEQSELEEPLNALREAGVTVSIVSPKAGHIQAMQHAEKGDPFPVDLPLAQAQVEEFDALLLPGGLINPDTLRVNPQAIDFVRSFATAGKLIAAICHGPWLLIEAGLVNGRKLTSWPAIQTDLKNAGAHWVDEEVVSEAGLVTSRSPADLPAFNAKILEQLAEVGAAA